MSEDLHAYMVELAHHASALEEINARPDLDRSEKSAIAATLLLLRTIEQHPSVSSAVCALIDEEKRRVAAEVAHRHAQVIWGRVNKTTHHAVKLTHDLGRVSQDMIDAAQQLCACALSVRDIIETPQVGSGAMDKIEASSHILREATKKLSGKTQSAMKINHDRMGEVLKNWTPINSIDALLMRFHYLGFAWAQPPQSRSAVHIQTIPVRA